MVGSMEIEKKKRRGKRKKKLKKKKEEKKNKKYYRRCCCYCVKCIIKSFFKCIGGIIRCFCPLCVCL